MLPCCLQDKDGVPYNGMSDTFRRLVIEGRHSPKGLLGVFFAGVQPRVMWISIGGFVFFGAYEQAVNLFTSVKVDSH
jgi:solute carrier family 25 S-adenosylmethionine transporter 26